MRIQAVLQKYFSFRPAEAEFEPITLRDIVKEAVPASSIRPAARKVAVKKPVNNYRERLVELFKFHNIPQKHHAILLKNLDNVNYANVNSALEMIAIRSFKFEPLKFKQSKPIMVIGMPGIGKTASIAKMAAEAKFYNRPVNIITTDIKRAGGVEQLQDFCRVLGVKMQIARNPKQLKEALKGKEKEITLIDSAGANPYDENDIELLRDLLKAGDIEPLFVLQAGGDADEAAELATSIKTLGTKRMVITKLDSAKRLGGMIAAALENDIALASFSSTPNVGKGLEPMTPKALSSQLLKAFVVEDKNA